MNRAQIDVIRLRCRADRIATARAVDRALRRELSAPDGLLVAELGRVTEFFGPAEHICVRRLSVELRLRVSRATGTAGIRHAWLAAAGQAVRDVSESAMQRLREGVLVSADGEVVIYETHIDAITDLVLGLSGSAEMPADRLGPEDLHRALDVDRAQRTGLAQDAGIGQGAGSGRGSDLAQHADPEQGSGRGQGEGLGQGWGLGEGSGLGPGADRARNADPGRRWDPERALDDARAWDVERASEAGRLSDVEWAGGAGPGRGGGRALDLDRAWAWAQCGLYSGPLPRSAAARAEVIARVLTSAPDLLPAVLARVDASLPLTPKQWVALAATWTRSQGSVTPTAPTDPFVADSPIVHAALGSPVGRALATHAQAVADLPQSQRQSLARLALATAAPHHSRDATAGAVAEALGTGPPAEVEPARPRSLEPQLTEYGGLLFLALAVDPVVTDIVVNDLPDVLARLCGRLAGVPPTDPAVLALTGIDPAEQPTPPDDELDALVEDRIRRWAVARLRLAPADDDLDWLWRRRAGVAISPGWIEAELSHADVDLRVRRAGLDLDPGWLWWRGAVLRWRYV